LIRTPRPLYADEDLGRDLDNAVYALDASTIDLRLSVFPWTLFRSTESAVKLQTLLDLQGNIPTFIHISDGKLHDVNVLDLLIPEPGAFYIMDRGYVDFERLFTLHRTGRFFVIRAKSTTKYRRRYSHPGDESGGVRCDRTIALSGVKSVRDYPLPSRRIRYHDVQTSKTFNFLTNNFAIPVRTVMDSTDTAGKLNCSSSGASNAYVSNRSSGPPRTRSKAGEEHREARERKRRAECDDPARRRRAEYLVGV